MTLQLFFISAFETNVLKNVVYLWMIVVAPLLNNSENFVFI